MGARQAATGSRRAARPWSSGADTLTARPRATGTGPGPGLRGADNLLVAVRGLKGT